MKRVLPLAVLLILAFGSACGDDSDDGGSSPTDTPAGGTDLPTGEPIRIGTFTSPSNLSATTAGAEAAIAAINEAGGIDGRPVELEVCNNENDPNKASECARGFANDSSIVATVGVISVFGGDTNPILENAGIAGIGTATASSGDFASPIVFPTSNSSLGILGASALLYDQLDANRQGLVMVDSPAAVALEGIINDNVLAPRGSKFDASAIIPLTAADVAPQASALVDTDGTVVALTPDLAIRYVQAARQQGYTEPMVVSASQLTASRLEESLGGFTDELYAVGSYDIDSPGWTRMVDEAEADDADESIVNDTFATAWLSVQLFRHVAESVTTIDRGSVLAAMNQLSNFDTEGMTAEPLNFTVDGDVLGGKAPNVIPAIQYDFVFKYKDGEYDSVGDAPQPIFRTR